MKGPLVEEGENQKIALKMSIYPLNTAHAAAPQL